MIIDRMLPGLDGTAIIRRLRDGGAATPALMIGVPGEVDHRLGAGGDGCLVKPFALAELLARVAALRPPQCHSERNGAARRQPLA
jgi:two-component system, OmpR family, response regulator